MKVKIVKIQDIPEVVIDRETVERCKGMSRTGPEVATIDVVDGEETTRFHIGVAINKRGQAVCEVSTNYGSGDSRKKVTGTKRVLG